MYHSEYVCVCVCVCVCVVCYINSSPVKSTSGLFFVFRAFSLVGSGGEETLEPVVF